MNKLALAMALGFGFVSTGVAYAKPSRAVRGCMKKAGCYKKNRKCHKKAKGLRGGERKRFKKACTAKFRKCRRACEAKVGE